MRGLGGRRSTHFTAPRGCFALLDCFKPLPPLPASEGEAPQDPPLQCRGWGWSRALVATGQLLSCPLVREGLPWRAPRTQGAGYLVVLGLCPVISGTEGPHGGDAVARSGHPSGSV